MDQRTSGPMLRRYTDPRGRDWMVWQITPHFSPRRSGRERRSEATEFQPDRRSGTDRRGTKAQWANGWLCFETTREKRRLVPVPPDWESCPAEDLERYRRMAALIQRSW